MKTTTEKDLENLQAFVENPATVLASIYDLPLDLKRLHSQGPIAYQQFVYCLVRELKPKLVVETGCRKGVLTALVLSALDGEGELWSCDTLYNGQEHAAQAITRATGFSPGSNWRFLPGRSQEFLDKVPEGIDIFIHDSDHGQSVMSTEIQKAWPKLSPGGLLIIDDWDTCYGARKHKVFEEFCESEKLSFKTLGTAAVVRKPRLENDATVTRQDAEEALGLKDFEIDPSLIGEMSTAKTDPFEPYEDSDERKKTRGEGVL